MIRHWTFVLATAWKVSKYGFFSGPYFSGFGLNTGKYGPEKTPYFEHYYCISLRSKSIFNLKEQFYGMTIGFQLQQRGWLFRHTVKPVYSGHLQFLKKVSAITRCPLYRVLDYLGKKRQQKFRRRIFFIRYE